MNPIVRHLRLEGRALWRVFHYQENNNDLRKFVLFVLIVTWAVITVGIAYQQAQVTPTYSMLTALIWAVVGRLWGGEVKDLTSSVE